jgi:hypothetical protein
VHAVTVFQVVSRQPAFYSIPSPKGLETVAAGNFVPISKFAVPMKDVAAKFGRTFHRERVNTIFQAAVFGRYESRPKVREMIGDLCCNLSKQTLE